MVLMFSGILITKWPSPLYALSLIVSIKTSVGIGFPKLAAIIWPSSIRHPYLNSKIELPLHNLPSMLIASKR